MPRDKRHADPKKTALEATRSFNPRADQVRSNLFGNGTFFDPRDLVQVKYEMLRHVEVDGATVSQAAADFGLSRPSFYQAKEDFEIGGIPALAGSKRGPKGGYKLSQEALDFIDREAANSAHDARALAVILEQKLGIKVHPRSIERARARRKKS